jgi:hypothetical protein
VTPSPPPTSPSIVYVCVIIWSWLQDIIIPWCQCIYDIFLLNIKELFIPLLSVALSCCVHCGDADIQPEHFRNRLQTYVHLLHKWTIGLVIAIVVSLLRHTAENVITYQYSWFTLAERNLLQSLIGATVHRMLWLPFNLFVPVKVNQVWDL